ncbi:hypothetical protein NDU88_005781 [Pleurodeles waltl]|uniref:Uncharacterized protein n=1 Tax=Pleurodeles waltl TaxID=8319 RepID=A0AAV7VP70_PLEWA|nr:hypothetical protein NDU88_005781 [Pleurodeles waltl]
MGLRKCHFLAFSTSHRTRSAQCAPPPPFRIPAQRSEARCSALLQAHPRTAWSLRRGTCTYVTSGIHRCFGTCTCDERGHVASLMAILSSKSFRPH